MHPVLLQFTIPLIDHRVVLPTYGFFLASAFLTAITLGHRRAMKTGFDPDVMGNFYLVLILSSMVGARAVYVWLEWPRYADRPWDALLLWKGGLVFYGGLAGGALGCWAYIRWVGESFARVSDLALPCLALGHLLGRLGCFFNGCCYGLPTDLPWGCSFPYTAHDFVARHPTQLYEAAGLAIIVLVTSRIFWRPHVPGTVAVAYATLYAPLRFVGEMYRGDDRGGTFVGGLSISQLGSVVVFAVGLVLWIWLARRAATMAPQEGVRSDDAPRSQAPAA